MLDPVVVVACVVLGFLETLDTVFGKLFRCRVVGNVSGQVVKYQFSDCIYTGVEIVVEVKQVGRLVGRVADCFSAFVEYTVGSNVEACFEHHSCGIGIHLGRTEHTVLQTVDA